MTAAWSPISRWSAAVLWCNCSSFMLESLQATTSVDMQVLISLHMRPISRQSMQHFKSNCGCLMGGPNTFRVGSTYPDNCHIPCDCLVRRDISWP